MVMSYSEMSDYIDHEVKELCHRLVAEGMEPDLVYVTLLVQAAYGYANMEGAEGMSDSFRNVANEMDAGDYKHAATDIDQVRPRLRLIQGGGGLKVYGRRVS